MVHGTTGIALDPMSERRGRVLITKNINTIEVNFSPQRDHDLYSLQDANKESQSEFQIGSAQNGYRMRVGHQRTGTLKDVFANALSPQSQAKQSKLGNSSTKDDIVLLRKYTQLPPPQTNPLVVSFKRADGVSVVD